MSSTVTYSYKYLCPLLSAAHPIPSPLSPVPSLPRRSPTAAIPEEHKGGQRKVEVSGGVHALCVSGKESTAYGLGMELSKVLTG